MQKPTFDILDISFQREPIKTLEADNKHVILTNGMHRFIVLRLLYLNERSKCSNNNLDKLPIVVAKTQYSISDDPKKLGYPQDFDVTVRDVKLYNGAGFITIYLGNMITMPGLPKVPNYEHIYLEDNKIVGLS